MAASTAELIGVGTEGGKQRRIEQLYSIYRMGVLAVVEF